MRIQGQKINAKWMREFMAYDPKRALARVALPILAITGSKDTQVNPANLADVKRIAKAWATIVEAPSVDHILRVEPAEFSRPQNYKKLLKTPIADAVTEPLLEWLATARAGKR